LAERTGLSRSRLTRGFKAATGMAPYAWMMHVRVQRAQDLLSRNGQPIVKVALELGFADQSHFTKTFKRFAGVTPREWQRAHKGTD
ncbi:MAG TPA: helix-turn-helix transcriptional regulator, partial [Bryobacteraceae bacterium]|nr:helix-turn-helix transcriptional regulator [Bryobacteraceae bacterium]